MRRGCVSEADAGGDLELVPVPVSEAARLRSEAAEALAEWLDWWWVKGRRRCPLLAQLGNPPALPGDCPSFTFSEIDMENSLQ